MIMAAVVQGKKTTDPDRTVAKTYAPIAQGKERNITPIFMGNWTR